jgi:hypothetical protein
MINKCCKRKLDNIVPEIEFTDGVNVGFWVFVGLCVIALCLIVYILLNMFIGVIVYFGNPSKVVVNTPEQVQDIRIIQESTFEFEVAQAPKQGCEYWFNYIDTMNATVEEKSWAQKIVRCESTCNPNAISYMGAKGIAQFTIPTWKDFGGDRDINNPYHQLEVALEMYRKGLQSRWCCNSII